MPNPRSYIAALRRPHPRRPVNFELLVLLVLAFCAGGLTNALLSAGRVQTLRSVAAEQRQLIMDQTKTLAGMQRLNDALKLNTQLTAAKCYGTDI